MEKNENVINIYTDGGARSSTNISGWAYVGYVNNETEIGRAHV